MRTFDDLHMERASGETDNTHPRRAITMGPLLTRPSSKGAEKAKAANNKW